MTRGWGVIRRRRDGWEVDISMGLQRVKRVLPTKDLAEKVLRRLREQLALGQYPAPLRTKFRSTYAQAIPGYLKSLDGKGLSPRSLESYLGDVKHLAAEWGARKIMRTTGQAVVDWVARMRQAGLTSSTIRHRLDRLAQLHRSAVEQGLIPREPCEVKRPRLVTRARDAYPEAELAALVERAGRHFDKRALAIVLLAADAGLRASEIAGLGAGDVADGIRVRSGKGGKERHVPVLTTRLRDALAAATPPFGVKSRDGLYTILAPVWPEPRLHELRHRFATVALGVPDVAPDDVRAWLGHGSLKVSAIYTHPRPGRVHDGLHAALQGPPVKPGRKSPGGSIATWRPKRGPGDAS